MSIEMINRVSARQDIVGVMKNVAFALANYADEHGVCYPSIKTVARWSGWKERACQKAIADLCNIGLLRAMRRTDSSNIYQFVMENWPQTERVRGAKERSLFDEMQLDLPGAPDSPPPVHVVHPPVHEIRVGGESGAPRTINEPSVKSSSSDSGDFKSPAVVESSGLSALVEHIEKRWRELKQRHPGIAGIRKIDDGMRHTIALRADQHAHGCQTSLELWDEFLDTIERSKFLCGEAPPGVGRDKPFKLMFTWALTAHHFREIIGGKYTDADGGGAAGRGLGPTAKATLGALESIRAARQRRGEGGDQGRDNR